MTASAQETVVLTGGADAQRRTTRGDPTVRENRRDGRIRCFAGAITTLRVSSDRDTRVPWRLRVPFGPVAVRATDLASLLAAWGETNSTLRNPPCAPQRMLHRVPRRWLPPCPSW